MSKKQATVEASGVTQRSPCDWTADTRGDGGNDSDALIGLIHVSTFSQERLVNGPITASESTPPNAGENINAFNTVMMSVERVSVACVVTTHSLSDCYIRKSLII